MMGDNMFGNTMWAGHWLWMLVIGILVVIPAWLGILMLIPMVNLVLLYFIAFAEWPADKTGGHNG